VFGDGLWIFGVNFLKCGGDSRRFGRRGEGPTKTQDECGTALSRPANLWGRAKECLTEQIKGWWVVTKAKKKNLNRRIVSGPLGGRTKKSISGNETLELNIREAPHRMIEDPCVLQLVRNYGKKEKSSSTILGLSYIRQNQYGRRLKIAYLFLLIPSALRRDSARNDFGSASK
jgi:hypothetical protein